MAVHGKAFQVDVNSVSLEEFLDAWSLSIDIDGAETTTSGDTAKTHLQGDYGWNLSGGGPADFTNTTGADETTFANIQAGALTTVLRTGSGAASATNPSYTGSAFLTHYGISCSVSDAVRADYAYQGTGALTRAEA